jgi:DNA mismatch repair ATPase MutS
MNPFLLFENKDFNLDATLPWNAPELTQDLELDTLFNAMAQDDKFLFDVVSKTLLTAFENDLNTILYRQDVLKDCIENATIIKELYKIVTEVTGDRKNHWFGIFTKHPSSILYSSRREIQSVLIKIKQIRKLADNHISKFKSKGVICFFSMIQVELNDAYLDKIAYRLSELEFSDGILISAELGIDNKGTNYTLRKLPETKRNWVQRIYVYIQNFFNFFDGYPPKWIKRLFEKSNTKVYTFDINPRDESGTRSFSELRDKGINQVANVLGQSTDHIHEFFNQLQTELAFYIGSLNLHEQLIEMDEPITFPIPVSTTEHKYYFKGIYDACLALTMKSKIVGNDVEADNKDLVIITGANQGGKSTLLRSIGLAQLMMQCGMFVPAGSFSASMCDFLFTHFKREEDNTMKSGKLDEELSRMNVIADHITSASMILFNESFAATNEREGSEIARQIINALIEKKIRVFFVTHLFDFAHSFYDKKQTNYLFLRAERQSDTKRTFKITEGEPLQTSYGEDLYFRIFENA